MSSPSYSIASQAAELAFNVYVAASAADRAAYDRRNVAYDALNAARKVSDEIDAVVDRLVDRSFAIRQAARAAYDALNAASDENDAAIAASDRSFAIRQASFDAWDKLSTARAEVAARDNARAPLTQAESDWVARHEILHARAAADAAAYAESYDHR